METQYDDDDDDLSHSNLRMTYIAQDDNSKSKQIVKKFVNQTKYSFVNSELSKQTTKGFTHKKVF